MFLKIPQQEPVMQEANNAEGVPSLIIDLRVRVRLGNTNFIVLHGISCIPDYSDLISFVIFFLFSLSVVVLPLM